MAFHSFFVLSEVTLCHLPVLTSISPCVTLALLESFYPPPQLHIPYTMSMPFTPAATQGTSGVAENPAAPATAPDAAITAPAAPLATQDSVPPAQSGTPQMAPPTAQAPGTELPAGINPPPPANPADPADPAAVIEIPNMAMIKRDLLDIATRERERRMFLEAELLQLRAARVPVPGVGQRDNVVSSAVGGPLPGLLCGHASGDPNFRPSNGRPTTRPAGEHGSASVPEPGHRRSIGSNGPGPPLCGYQ